MLAVEIPKHRGIVGELEAGEAELLHTLVDFRIVLPRARHAGQVAFDIGQEHRHADTAEIFGHDPQTDGFPRTCCPGDQPMAIGHAWQQRVNLTPFGNRQSFEHIPSSPYLSPTYSSPVTTLALCKGTPS